MKLSMLFIIFTFKDPNLVETLKIVGTRGFMGLAFSNFKDPWYLVTWSLGQVPRGVVFRIFEGKSRVEALLNSDLNYVLRGTFLMLNRTGVAWAFLKHCYDQAY